MSKEQIYDHEKDRTVIDWLKGNIYVDDEKLIKCVNDKTYVLCEALISKVTDENQKNRVMMLMDILKKMDRYNNKNIETDIKSVYVKKLLMVYGFEDNVYIVRSRL